MKSTSASPPLHLRGRLWIEAPEGTFVGEGRVRLLENIRDLGSISAAAKQMKMSYRQAWGLVKVMNQHSPSPLVEKAVGGKGGGGAQLTQTGVRAIDLYHSVMSDFEAFLAQRSVTLSMDSVE